MSSLLRFTMMRIATVSVFLFVELFIFTGCSTVVSPTPLEAPQAASMTRADDGSCAAVLHDFVRDGLVDYAALRTNRAQLDRCVAIIAAVGPTSRPDLFPQTHDRLAYYINAYNLLTIFNVVNRLDIVRVIDDKILFFVSTRFVVDGVSISLYSLENDVVRKQFNDPRVHFALNCASFGCPVLPSTLFTGAALDAELERETQAFLHQQRNVQVVDRGGKSAVVLSNIFDWYKDDFDNDPVAYVRTHAADLQLPLTNEYEYDWTLNDIKSSKPR